jgi:hypothetical protein
MRQVGATRPTVAAVQEVMRDDRPRTDAEITRAVNARYSPRVSQDAIRHARLALCRAGFVVATSVKRATKNGGNGTVWVRAA